MKRLLITGAKGQLGTELTRQAQGQYEVLAAASKTLDISDGASVKRVVAEFAPDFVINAAAYTAVDKAESEAERAYAVNVDGSRHLAQACAHHNARLIHVSTDFVFDGKSSTPYKPGDATNPLSVYGKTKCDGERAILNELGNRACIVRTSWVYGPGGNNFVKTMLRLMAEREQLNVVMDQIGSPTSTVGLANTLLKLLALDDESSAGLHHWTDAGVASWYDFAVAIREFATQLKPDQAWATVLPIYTENYPTPAHRPNFSLLDSRGLQSKVGRPLHWRAALAAVFPEIMK